LKNQVKKGIKKKKISREGKAAVPPRALASFSLPARLHLDAQ
jgi:hypothetical protein